MRMANLTPEQEAREQIDALLEAAGWHVQSLNVLNLGASVGVAVREFPLSTGKADYLLFVDRKAVGVIEAKKVGTTLSHVEDQSEKYTVGLPKDIPHVELPLPFAYESTGIETHFRDNRDPSPRSRRVFSFHRPETLLEWVGQPDTLRARLQHMPPLIPEGLWRPQVEAVMNLEESFAADRPRALIQMATGSGKTFTACTFVYRLIKFAGAKRVLFLVDRNSLSKQTLREFQQYTTPDDGRKFTELYNAQRLTTNAIDPVCKVTISTIQRVFSMLKGEPEFDEGREEGSSFEVPVADDQPIEVVYNPTIPIEEFDFIVTDECHRSIYNLWRQVLEYFDAHIIGLTATPSKQTLGFFGKNLVQDYSHERACADGINCNYDVYRIRTEITEKGSKVDAGFFVDKRDKATREVRWEELDADFQYAENQLDRDVVSRDQIRTVIRTFRDKLFTEIFPGRTEVPKTLIFAKDDSHAEDIVEIAREEFGKGNEFAKKITYRSKEKPEDLIASLRNSYFPRIAVTVDLVSTGVDVKPLECLLFMRDVRSRSYFEQMIGRGTRIINPTDLEAVTPDAKRKTHFVIVDAVGVCESVKVDTRPLEKKKTATFESLLQSIAVGKRDDDTLSTLASRLMRMGKTTEPKDIERIEEASGKALTTITNGVLDAIDPDKHMSKAAEMFGADEPTQEQVAKAKAEIVQSACAVFDAPKFRDLLVEIKKRNEQVIDNVSVDEVLEAGFSQAAKDKAKETVAQFRDFLETHKDEISALQIIYSKPYGQRHLTYEAIKELYDALSQPPNALYPEVVWHAYEQLDSGKVARLSQERMLTNIISLVRYTLGEVAVLEPFVNRVDERFMRWLAKRQAAGTAFTDEQVDWLRQIKDHIATSLTIEMDDFDYAPFQAKGGRMKVFKLFGDKLGAVLAELNQELAA